MLPIPISVVTTGMSALAASAATSRDAFAAITPPPASSTGRLASLSQRASLPTWVGVAADSGWYALSETRSG